MVKVHCDGPNCKTETTPEDARQQWWVLTREMEAVASGQREFCCTGCAIAWLQARENTQRLRGRARHWGATQVE